MKLLFKILILFIVLTIGWKYFLKNSQKEPLVSFSDKTGGFSVSIREPEKEELKEIVKRVKDLVYREATIHNPSGDILPDNIDNSVIREVKEKVN